MSPVAVSYVTRLSALAMRAAACVARQQTDSLRILLWHGVVPDYPDRSNISVTALDRQLRWLGDHGYNVLAMSDVLRRHTTGQPLPPRAVVLTFDDACASFPRYALPCLQRAGFDATLLVPVAAVCGQSPEMPGVTGHMSLASLENLPGNIDIGLHSYAHEDYRRLSAQQISDDLRRCTAIRQRLQRRVLPVFAYPFGGVPADHASAWQMQQQLATNGIELGLRIGYGINRWPLEDPWRVRRITIHGNDSFAHFVAKLTFGRIKL